MHIAESARSLAIRELGLPEYLVNFLVELQCADDLKYLFNFPYCFYARGPVDESPYWPELRTMELLPLWEHFESVCALDLGCKPPRYLRFFVESPEDFVVFGYSVHSALFHMLMLHVWDYGGGKKEAADALNLAEQLHFPDISRLSTMLQNPSTGEEDLAAYIEFLELSARTGA